MRRQQASAIISAREKIVEGAVSMVRMALHKLSEEEIVELDEDKKAAMVSNLLVVLCADEAEQPVVNTGTLNHKSIKKEVKKVVAKKESSIKSFVLRVDDETMDDIEKYAADEFRSTNGQLQWNIAEALKKSGRLKKKSARAGSGPSEPSDQTLSFLDGFDKEYW